MFKASLRLFPTQDSSFVLLLLLLLLFLLLSPACFHRQAAHLQDRAAAAAAAAAADAAAVEDLRFAERLRFAAEAESLWARVRQAEADKDAAGATTRQAVERQREPSTFNYPLAFAPCVLYPHQPSGLRPGGRFAGRGRAPPAGRQRRREPFRATGGRMRRAQDAARRRRGRRRDSRSGATATTAPQKMARDRAQPSWRLSKLCGWLVLGLLF